MTALKHSARCAALGVLLLSPASHAGDFKGYVGLFSDYLFRGIESSGGVALQGGVDYTHETGLYAGLWTSNTTAATNELDLYGGYKTKLGEFTVWGGAIGYLFTENEERGGGDISYAELYAGGNIGPISLVGYYTDDYFSTDRDGVYVTAKIKLPLTETISFAAQAGISTGDGVEAAVGDSYTDYGVWASKLLDEGFYVHLGVFGTDLDRGRSPFLAGDDDQPKFAVGVEKEFDI